MSLKVCRWMQMAMIIAAVVLLCTMAPLPLGVSAQDATPTVEGPPTIKQYGRLTEETDFLTDPHGMVIDEQPAGMEFELLKVIIVDDDPDDGVADRWVQVEFLSGGTGWINASGIQLANLNSTATLRRYENDICIATPIEADHIGGLTGLIKEYQHELFFDAAEVNVSALIEAPAYLAFAGEVLQVEVRADVEGNGLLLPATWVARHTWLTTRWDTIRAWQLQFACEAPDDEVG